MSAREQQRTARRLALQERLAGDGMPLPGSARDLFLEIRRHLVEASDEGALSSSQSDIFRLLKTAESPFRDRDQKAIVGGEKDLKRTGDHPCFVRHDGARLHFTITVTQRAGEPLFLFAYDFELMFPKDLSPRFVRFDLNEPDHRNDREGIRSHLHPGHDDLQVPAPLLHPVELLDVLIYDAVHPEKQRRA